MLFRSGSRGAHPCKATRERMLGVTGVAFGYEVLPDAEEVRSFAETSSTFRVLALRAEVPTECRSEHSLPAPRMRPWAPAWCSVLAHLAAVVFNQNNENHWSGYQPHQTTPS